MPHSKPQLLQSKICSKCKQEKSLTEFSRRSNRASRYRSECKVCQSETSRAWRIANPEREEKRRRAWYKANREKRAEYDVRQRSKYPERWAARSAVSSAVHIGKMPPARDFPCSVCGESAQQYHHYLGYAPQHRLDVIPVCLPCHVELDKGLSE